MMEHFYQKLPGYFTFPDFYGWAASEFRDGHGVEVGSFMGRSAAYFAVELLNHGGKGRLDLVDTFTNGVSALDVLRSLHRVRQVIGNVHGGLSWEGASLYGERSLDWVYIDADHHYEPVCRDIDAWLPKVKPGGVLAGHDYCDYPGFGVIQAVTERFSDVKIWQGERFSGDGVRPLSTEGFGRHYPSWSVRIPMGSASTLHYYGRAFFDQMHAQRSEAIYFADSIFYALEGVKSAFDVGAGIGTQTLRLKERGWDIRGGDFAPLAIEQREKGIAVERFDLTQVHGGAAFPWPLVDCVICTEVAEHVPSEHSDSIVDNVSSMASAWVVWSAAPPGQGGDGHINLQPPHFWLDKFAKKGWAQDIDRTRRLRVSMVRQRSLHHHYADNFYVLSRGVTDAT